MLVGGWSLLPLFLSCLGSLLAPNLCRLLATKAEILARAGGGGRAVCPKLCACLKESIVGAKGRGCRILRGAASLATIQYAQSAWAGNFLKPCIGF